MVIKGNYSVQIINAKTRKPLREHTSYTGKVYTIIDPNESYLLKLEVSDDLEKQDESGVLLWKSTINGKSSSIGYAYPSSSSKNRSKRNASRSCSYLGFNGMGSPSKCQKKIGSATATSTATAKSSVKRHRHHPCNTNTMMTNITVDIYECVSAQHGKSAAVANRKASSRNSHQRGKLLDSVTLLCCFSTPTLPFLNSMYLDSSYSSPIATRQLWNGLWNRNEGPTTISAASSYYWNHHVNATAPSSPTTDGAVAITTSHGMKPAIKI